MNGKYDGNIFLAPQINEQIPILITKFGVKIWKINREKVVKTFWEIFIADR